MSYKEKRYLVSFNYVPEEINTFAAFVDRAIYDEVYSSNGPKSVADYYLEGYAPTHWHGSYVTVADVSSGRIYTYHVVAAPRLSPYTPAGACVSA